MLSVQSFDLAQDTIRERLQRAANDALVQQAIAASPQLSRVRAARLKLATSLRAVAARLDPSLCCEPCLTVAPVAR